jgi:hypothetical protein
MLIVIEALVSGQKGAGVQKAGPAQLPEPASRPVVFLHREVLAAQDWDDAGCEGRIA